MSGVLPQSASSDRVPRSCVTEHRSVCNMTKSETLSVEPAPVRAINSKLSLLPARKTPADGSHLIAIRIANIGRIKIRAVV